MKLGGFISMRLSWSGWETVVAWAGVAAGEMAVGGFEVYFVGCGGQLDVKVQGRKQSKVQVLAAG